MKKDKYSKQIRLLCEVLDVNFADITDDDIYSQKYMILKTGQYYDPRYGDFKVTPKLLEALKKNFDDNVLGIDVAIDLNHNPAGGAFAWIKSLEIEGNALYMVIKDVTEEGKKILKEKIYKYFSVEFGIFDCVKKGKKMSIHDVLKGVALTNRPVIKGMKPTFMSEDAPVKDYVSNLFYNDSNMDTFKVFADKLLSEDSISAGDFETLKAMHKTLSEEDQEATAETLEKAEEKVEEEKVEEEEAT